jgi:hypothetical protein
MYPGTDEDIAIVAQPRTSSRSSSVAEPATTCLITDGTKVDYLGRRREKERQLTQESFLAQVIHDKMVHIFTDGGARPNPRADGWGFVMRQNESFTYNCGHYRHTSNNAIEIRPVIEALRLLPKNSYTCISTDSAYVNRRVTEWLNDWMNVWAIIRSVDRICGRRIASRG